MITLFSTNCPACNVLKQKLDDAEVSYELSYDVQEIIDKGFMTAPILKIDDSYLTFKEALDWIKEQS